MLFGVTVAAWSTGCEDGPLRAVSVAATPDLRFEPAEVTVAAGGTVTWQFGGVPHNVWFTSGAHPPDDIPELTANASVSRTFTTAGSYDYECRVHPGMTGRVIVKGASGSGY